MSRSAEWSLSLLESREVPAAGLFADLRPGVWGSYPQNITPSGDTLFFSAETTLGRELYAADGTAAGTRLVKDINPGRLGSDPSDVIPAGNGVVYFGADDGGGRTLWRSDGTAAGTRKATGMPEQLQTAFQQKWAGGLLGLNGELHFVTTDLATGVKTWAKTGGQGVTTLATFGGPNSYSDWQVVGGRVELAVKTQAGTEAVWESDGTPAGTRVKQANLTATSPTTGAVKLSVGAEVSPGRYVFGSDPDNGSKASVWVGDGTGTSRTLLKAFDATPYTLYIDTPTMTAAGGKVFFRVDSASSPRPADVGLWVTDGTAAGTTRVNVPTASGMAPKLWGTLGDRAVVEAYLPNPATGGGRAVYLLTDGTTSTPLPAPAGTENAGWFLVGPAPADAAAPNGYLLFQNAGGRVYRTDGTPAGTALIDTTGLPAPPPMNPPILGWRGGADVTLAGMDLPFPHGVGQGVGRGAYLNGSVFYSGKTDTQRAELWKWDLAAAPATPAPKLTNALVNDGSAQRSMVKSISVTFDAVVSVDMAGVTITTASGQTAAFTGGLTTTAAGRTTLTLLPAGVGQSFADGRYTLTIKAGAVKTVTGGTAMASDYTFGFTRVYGDTSGDGVYDRSTRTLVKQLLGQEVGDPGYRWDLDVNSDGRIDAADELAAVRNWGKAV